MGIERAPHNREHPYTVLDNEILDSDLSNNAKVVMWALLRNRDDWKPHRTELMTRLKMTRKPFDKSLKELKEAGYLDIVRIQGERGHYDYDWNIREIASTVKKLDNQSIDNDEASTQPESQSLTDVPKGDTGNTNYPISLVFRIDFDYFIADSPLSGISERDRTTLFVLAGRLNHEMIERGCSYPDGTEKETSRMMKVAVIRSIKKQPNPIGYIVSTVNNWIQNDMVDMTDLENQQETKTGKKLSDILGMRDASEDYIYQLDNNDIEWDLL